LLLLFFVTPPLLAKEHSCTIKQFINERRNESLITCELHNVKFDEKLHFGLKLDNSTLEELQMVQNVLDGLNLSNATQEVEVINLAGFIQTINLQEVKADDDLVGLNQTIILQDDKLSDDSVGSNQTENIQVDETVNLTESNQTNNFTENEANNLIQRLKFKSSKLSMIPNIIFVKFKQLKVFDSSNVDLRSINSLSFNQAEHLREIYLQNNRLKVINSYGELPLFKLV
jgi:hypothetical protein